MNAEQLDFPLLFLIRHRMQVNVLPPLSLIDRAISVASGAVAGSYFGYLSGLIFKTLTRYTLDEQNVAIGVGLGTSSIALLAAQKVNINLNPKVDWLAQTVSTVVFNGLFGWGISEAIDHTGLVTMWGVFAGGNALGIMLGRFLHHRLD